MIDVAAAVLLQADGSFLLAQRPPGKIWAGYWEFPGGKLETGETPLQALKRELLEELGVTVKTAYPWITRIFVYPHATVRLHFFRITAWSGTLHPHEGQSFSWQLASDFSVTPILPANSPIIRALELPELYAISNVHDLGENVFMKRLENALVRGLRMVQLREKAYEREALRLLAQRMQPLLKSYQAQLIINSDIELAREIGAEGVQLTSKQLTEIKERPDMKWCAASCHNAEELHRAEALGCDFAQLSPVMPTQSHPGMPHLGWDRFADVITGSSIPVYALGGLSHEDMKTAWRYGAHGLALLRQAW